MDQQAGRQFDVLARQQDIKDSLPQQIPVEIVNKLTIVLLNKLTRLHWRQLILLSGS